MAARATMAEDDIWDVPYIPIDPHDIGREYEEIIRINSQSGKGGSAWILEQDYGIFLPKAMHPDVGQVITATADTLQREVTPEEIYDIFKKQWLEKKSPLKIVDLAETHLDSSSGSTNGAHNARVMCMASVEWQGQVISMGAKGNGPLDAFVAALASTPVPKFSISAFHEHSIGTGSDTDAMAYIQITLEDGKKLWGCGKSSNIGRAGIKAVVSAINQIA
jgi:2-isopropylmalate synthase